ncbi:MAG: gamma-glutamyltransferase [Cyclobacteriaceae bacterium]
MKYQSRGLAIAIFLLTACQPTKQPLANNSVVSAAHPLATKAGISILEQGGNAYDAAIATGFAIAVVEQTMNGLGGRLQAIIHHEDGKITGIDATTQAPLSYDPETATMETTGYPSIGVPGVVKGLMTIHEKYGSMDLATVMAPAIDYAENGYIMLPEAAKRHASVIEYIRKYEGSSQYFLNGDTTYVAGERLVQKDLANTLRKIAETKGEAFYTGEIAEKMVADIQANGGYVDMESLAAYEAKESRVLTGSYRGYDINTLFLPAFGAINLEMLNFMENYPLSEYSDADWGKVFFLANTIAYKDRRRQSEDGAVEEIISKEYAKQKADSVNALDLKAAAMAYSGGWASPDGHTTHFTVADKNGIVLAVTQTVGNTLGSKVATPGLGFVYAQTLGGYLGDMKAGDRAPSHISPTIVAKDGKPFLGLGAAGGSRIPTAIVQAISRVIDRGMNLPDALAAGRIQSIDTAMYIEMHEGTTWTQEDIDALESFGFKVYPVEEKARFGRIHAVHYDVENQNWTGAADPDWEGTSDGVEKE